MPPKKKGQGPKLTERQKQKLVEDKTFGMKNKKGAKGQQKVAQMKAQISSRSKGADRKGKKQTEAEEKAMLNDLFRPVKVVKKTAEDDNAGADKKKEEKDTKPMVPDEPPADMDIEEWIDKKRATLPTEKVKVTYESFMEWKRRKKAEQQKKLAEEQKKKKKAFKEGKLSSITGRDMFEMKPDVNGVEGEDEEGFDDQPRETEEETDKDKASYFDASVFEKDWDKMAKTDEEANALAEARKAKAKQAQQQQPDSSSSSAAPASSENAGNASSAAPVDEDLFASADLADLNLDDEDLDED